MAVNKEEEKSKELKGLIAQGIPWIIENGISFVFVFVLVIVIGSWFIRYPYFITSKVMILKQNNSTFMAKGQYLPEEVFSIKEKQPAIMKLKSCDDKKYISIYGNIISITPSETKNEIVFLVGNIDNNIELSKLECALAKEIEGTIRISTNDERVLIIIFRRLKSMIIK